MSELKMKQKKPTGFHMDLYWCSSGEGSAIQLPDCGPKDLQKLLQQRNYLKNINPRDTINLNLRKAFLEYDTDL